MEITHIIKQHSELPALELTLLDPRNNPVDLTDASSIVLRMQLINDTTVVGGGAVDIVSATGGTVSYTFTPADTQIAGLYMATVKVTFPGSQIQSFPFNDYYLVLVNPDLFADSDDPSIDLVFATVADAKSMGYALTPEQLKRAEGFIEANCGRMIAEMSETVLSSRDASILKKATVYQAEWLKTNADAEQRTDLKVIRTAGLSGESAEFTSDGIILAPLARRLLTKLSWVRSRSINVRPKGTGTIYTDRLVRGDEWGWRNF